MYEFATGTGPDRTVFTEKTPYTRAIKQSKATKEALTKLLLDPGEVLKNGYKYKFSPDQTGGDLSKMLNDGLLGQSRGGMKYNFEVGEKENTINVTVTDGYTNKSAYYRLRENAKPSDKMGRTKSYEFQFKFTVNPATYSKLLKAAPAKPTNITKSPGTVRYL